jgi:cell wall-associated NlpC family hydrolase
VAGPLGLFCILPGLCAAMTHNVVLRTPLDLARVKITGLSPLPFGKGLVKGTGTLESAEVFAPAPFEEVVASWNADLPKGASLELEVQAHGKWYLMARVNGTEHFSPPAQEDDSAKVDIDTLKLKKPALSLRWRARLTKGSLKLVALALSSKPDPAEPPSPFGAGPWIRELPVPERSQTVEQEKYKHDVCSPSSLSAVIEFWGKKVKTSDMAERVRDQTSQLFGDWPFNVSVAATLGLEGYVARLSSLSGLENEIARGRPVVVSITFGEGELKGSPIKKTRGHVIVVTGFTDKGDVIVMDPAGPAGATRRVYDRSEFHRAWRIRKSGLAYLLGKPWERELSVGVPVAELQAGPRSKKTLSLDDSDHKSQLLYGEKVTPLELKSGWVRITADEQLDYLEGKRWQGYPGWVRVESLSGAVPPAANVVVRTRQALAHRGKEIIVLSVGTRLRRVSANNDESRVLLLDGGTADLATDSLFDAGFVSTPASRAEIIRTAELFLGTSYYWGGRSGVQPDLSVGVDCSGLVNLAYRAQDVDIPRDAHEQKLRSRSIEPAQLAPGDLVFLSESAASDKITHVMLYTGGDGVIESRQSSGRVLRSSFTERFGKPLAKISGGDTVTDLSDSKPRERKIWFGTFF